jgi:hypothetical protein
MALVGSRLLEQNLTDAGSVWNNTEQVIVQLQVIRDAFVLRQAGPRPSSVGAADDLTINNEQTYPTSSHHEIDDSVRSTNHIQPSRSHEPKACLSPFARVRK